MNAPGIPSAPLTGFSTSPVQQRPPILSVVPVSAPASGSAGALSSSAASGSASAPGLGSAGLGPQSSGLSSGHIPSHDPGQDQSQPATSPSSASATGGGAAGTGYLQRSRRRWTADEDAKLISAVKAYGSARGPGSAWSLISQGIPGRTNKDCRKRWFHSLDPSVRKGKWSPNEDDALRRLYSELGPQWKEIALRIPGRKDDQVSKRWRDVLAPELTSKKPWSSKEDTLLLDLLEKLGPRWTAIADKLPGRSPIACRNRSRKFRKQRPETNDTPSSTGASGNGGGSAAASRSESGAASAGPSTVPLPPMSMADGTPSTGTSSALPPGAVEDEPDWRLPADLNPSISVSSFNFDLHQNRAVPPGPLPGASGAASSGPPSAAPPGAPGAPPGAGGPGHAPNMMADGTVLAMGASPAVGTSALPLAHDSVSPTAHLDQPLPQIEGGWMQPPMQMGLGVPMFDRAVDDMWGLFVALDRGDNAVLVDSNLLRQLVAGAASGIGQPPMPGRA